ncbi:hypothetical protein BDV96DRAFT_600541 [Lophiotrema nucula]|uniref:Uncharacterized protein n=1 Tax=Lophiotrema nucula TaxID=690887 RepID=A0A6A5Z871_9PLEO|nr:hypothetical protein BDV96DRAFT_600541 [Lophiotrema nucula]
MSLESGSAILQSQLNLGRGVWTKDTVQEVLKPLVIPKTVLEIGTKYGAQSIKNEDLYSSDGMSYGDDPAHPHLKTKDGQGEDRAGFEQQWQMARSLYENTSMLRQLTANMPRLLDRLDFESNDPIRLVFYGLGSFIDGSREVFYHYLAAAEIVDAVRTRAVFTNKKVDVLFHDINYYPSDEFHIKLKFRRADEKPIFSNNHKGVTGELFNYEWNSAIVITFSSKTPYRQILSETILREAAQGCPYPKAALCVPSNDEDDHHDLFKRNNSSELVSDWLQLYSQPPLELVEKNDYGLGNIFLFT